ncbi:MAG: class I SAM-dependent methyltransferase family protein [Candidatus Aenigmarchaeota archaeon]|nr:class I SAM-dependent methyltransferase family protein [Candidatus Aenigmarchaeota archaeon]
MRLKDLLKDKIPDKLLSKVPGSFEIVGSREKAVAIVEIGDELDIYKHEIGKAIAQINKNVKIVLRKTSERIGEFRIRKYERIYGEGDTEVIHKEYGYLIKVDPTKAYFSSRESAERQRIASMVKPGERILVMFSGVAPFAIAIAKKQPFVREIVCVEKNPDAHRYAIENVRLNKLEDKVKCINGDVNEICPKFGEKYFDRILMPLPKGAYEFLDIAIPSIKKHGILHFYYWGEEPIEKTIERGFELIKNAANKISRKANLISGKKVLPYAPRVWKVVIDAEIV